MVQITYDQIVRAIAAELSAEKIKAAGGFNSAFKKSEHFDKLLEREVPMAKITVGQILKQRRQRIEEAEQSRNWYN